MPSKTDRADPPEEIRDAIAAQQRLGRFMKSHGSEVGVLRSWFFWGKSCISSWSCKIIPKHVGSRFLFQVFCTSVRQNVCGTDCKECAWWFSQNCRPSTLVRVYPFLDASFFRFVSRGTSCKLHLYINIYHFMIYITWTLQQVGQTSIG